jgi:type IV pilus assembly protein PilW
MRVTPTVPKGPMHSPERGMSLIEILVGIVIGMLGILVIFSVLSVAEGRKRTTTAATDAQMAGAVALFSLERDIKQGGYGFGTFAVGNPINCTVDAYDVLRGGGTQDFDFPLAPALIQQGASGAPDTIAVLYGNTDLIVAGKTFTFSSNSTKATSSTLGGRTGILRGDVLLLAGTVGGALACQLIEVTANTNADAVTIDHNTGTYTPQSGLGSATARYNKATGPAFTNGFIYELGSSPRRNLWSIQGGRLVVRDDIHWSDADGDGGNDPVAVYDDIIDLQAEYGVAVDSNGDGRLDRIGAWTTVAPPDMASVYAIRVGLLARSKQAEKGKVTGAAPSWAGGSFVMRNVDGTTDSDPGDATAGDANNWRNYRYRAYETLVPLRNIVWGSMP